MSDHVLFRQALRALLATSKFTASELDSKARSISAKNATALVVDLDHVSVDTSTLIRRLEQQLPETRIVAIGNAARLAVALGDRESTTIAVETDAATGSSLAAAIGGRSPRGSTELSRAKRTWTQLTERQLDVLRRLASGMDNAEIADQLDVGVRAIKQHVSAMLLLFDVPNRARLALIASEAGLRVR